MTTGTVTIDAPVFPCAGKCPECRSGDTNKYPPESDGCVMAECNACGHLEELPIWKEG